MIEFLEAARSSEIMQRALITGVLAGIACGVVGSYVVVRRITYIAGGIAHCVLGGIGAAVYLRKVHGWQVLAPIHGALAAALLAAGIIGLVTLRLKQREDTVISAMWATGMAAGVLFLNATPGFSQDLMTYLFGNITLISPRHVWLLVGLDILVLLVAVAFYKQFLAICYDEEFARVRGVWVEGYYLLLLGLIALVVVLLTTVVGILLVIALLTLPVAVAGHYARRLWHMMLLAALLSTVLTVMGMAAAYAPELPVGPVIVLLTGATYLLVMGISAVRSRLGGAK